MRRRDRRRAWWRQFFSGDNTQVNTMAVIGVLLAAPVACISFLALLYDIFYLAKGLTGSAVQLLLGLLTAATGGIGVSMFSKTTMFSQMTTGLSSITGLPPPPLESRPRVRPNREAGI